VDAKKTSEGQKRKGSSSKAILLLAAVAVAGSAFWLTHKRPAQGQTAEGSGAPVDTVKSSLHLESFVVNLADPGQPAFLRVGIDLGLDQAPSGDPKTSPLMSKIRDVTLSVLTSCQSSDLVAPDGKDKLKEQLLKALHERVPELPVREIYFTEFLVQR
jgi:flagellar basal body-associated protein FliL